MALSKEDYDRYLEALKNMAASRSVITYCIRNLNRPPEAAYNSEVFKGLDRLSTVSHDTINEVMSKVLLALLSRAEIAEENLKLAEMGQPH